MIRAILLEMDLSGLWGGGRSLDTDWSSCLCGAHINCSYTYHAYRGDGTKSFPIDLNTSILENTSLRIAASLDHMSFKLVDSKFKQAKKKKIIQT